MKPFLKTYKKGSFLFHENDHSRELYVIQEGTVDIVRKSGNREVLLASVEKGAVIGEMALIDGKPRSASARAANDVTVVLIGAEAFHEKIAGVPPWFVSIIKTTSQKIRNANLRLEHIHDTNRALSIIIMLGRFFQRFGTGVSGVQRLRLSSTRQRIIRLMGVTYERAAQAIEFLCCHGFVEVSDDQISVVEPSRFASYCRFLRGVQRKLFDGMTVPDQSLGKFLQHLMREYPLSGMNADTPFELSGSQITELCEQAQVAAQQRTLVQDLRELGICKTRRSADASPSDASSLEGVIFTFSPQTTSKWGLLCTFGNLLPTA